MFSDSQFAGEDISALDIKMPGRAVLFMDSGEYPLQLLFWFGVFFASCGVEIICQPEMLSGWQGYLM